MRRFILLLCAACLNALPVAAEEPPAEWALDRALMVKKIEQLSIDVTWSRVPWKTCPVEAYAEARRTGKPVLIWALAGDPEGRC